MALKDGTPEDYGSAARRHYQDAETLNAAGRFDNAGHLIGFAAECAIKHKIYSLGTGDTCPDLHLPHLLPAARKRLGERAGFSGMYNILKSDVFTDWAVDFRYSPDGKIKSENVTAWFAVTRRLLAAANVRVRLP